MKPMQDAPEVLFPHAGMSDAQEEMRAAREADELDLLAMPFQGHEILLTLLDRAAQISFAMQQ